jgi:hypothetical protein
MAGATFRQIGDRMGFTEQRAHALVTQELARLNAQRAESAAAVTRLEVERLDALLLAVWSKALHGDLPALDRVLAILARRAKLLGIDAEKPAPPNIALQNVNVNVESMTDAERADAIAALLSRVGGLHPRPAASRPAEPARLPLGAPGNAADGLRDDAGPLANSVPPLFG